MMCEIIKCKYYPCAFPQQSCKYCYCPFYPCKYLPTGGTWFETSNGSKVWDCTYCFTVHYTEVVKLIRIDANEKDGAEIRDAWHRLVNWLERNTDNRK